METAPRVTLQKIADAVGVVRSTVSKALHNSPRIPEPTRKRIQEAARDLGYQPAPAISALMSQLRRHRHRRFFEPIAYLAMSADWRKGLHAGGYFRGAARRAEALGFRVEPFFFGDVAWNGPRFSQILRARNIRGVLIAPVPSLETRVVLDWEHFCTVAFGHSLKYPRCHRVTSDQYRTVLNLLYQLDVRGYRRIGYLYPRAADERVLNYFFAAFSVYQSRLPSRYRVPPLLKDSPSPKECVAWINRHHPDAIISVEGGNLDWLQQEGIRVPEDIGIAFFAARNLHLKGLAGMDQNPEAIGETAMELVAEQLYENRCGLPKVQKMVLIEGEWRDGWTVQDKRTGPSLDWIKLL